MSVPAATGDEGRKTLHEELDELRVDVIRLAALTTEAIAAGTQALARRRPRRWPKRSIEADDVIDELYHRSRTAAS